jgi:hypothetical protein
LIEKPVDLNSTREVNQRYVYFYNFERPNQAITCGNQPPRVKFPDSPSLLPVPEIIDPDRWLSTLTGRTYKRRLDRKGCFQLGNQTYYVKQQLRGQIVLIWVDGQKKQLNVYVSNGKLVKTLPIKGLQNRKMNFQEYLDLMCKEAVSTWRKVQSRTTRYG